MLRDDIRLAIVVGAKDFLSLMRRDWPGQKMYGFLFEVNCEGNSVFAVAGTEEGLERVAQRYYEKGYRSSAGDSLTAIKKMLRWGSPEDGWYSNYDARVYCRTP